MHSIISSNVIPTNSSVNRSGYKLDVFYTAIRTQTRISITIQNESSLWDLHSDPNTTVFEFVGITFELIIEHIKFVGFALGFKYKKN